ncbi:MULTISPECIES: FKBP-type peptidyl-prolyl cis-trans isomerase [Rhodanobacter]|uniref:Peptidyl-prolyl cis-trans isomerase n=1 Tax=Rhodanobacter denitrificans TaxID=666685 RepID=M4NES2_9GAMM|nr:MULTISPECIES: FKBP-type peptidyl-prolyl cis-trans isomerase [Rhodanobacter]AGG89355.1 FKBP-type peptidyl-prolyl cis-trans isomerase [Rhodanobacter denitrificans]KZC20565.1 peptidylprolyl isomerase [Rhodanobacter denitrificans]UJJ49544.1 FKBP-type peptidyl-prolyl cis-trans isomerase [Rhodanobacter denitrificans]UJJ58254.1 FKBP-type peptidyl-prolyl cis-trans isomerase [Rhodanobacter denitrificans]UJM88238.1 FKBP-type peptidyl-prolyl cis-trans isomerase [Rhodanobacter denitrificans]
MKHFLRPTLTAVAMAVALGMTAGAAAQTAGAAGTVDKAKASYVVGWEIASQVPPIMRDELDPNAVANAVKAALSGQKPTMSETEAKQVHEAFMAKIQAKYQAEMTKLAAKNKAEGDAFLAKNKTAPGVKTTASGLQYQVISQGTGARPGPNDTVEINYTGTFVDGQVFDASAKHNPPGAAKIPLAGVIPGFREGLQLMQVSGHYKLFIPAALAYGAEPQPPMPPNATLIFDVTLVKTGPTPAGAAPADK